VRLAPSPGDRDRFPVPTIHAYDQQDSFPGIGALLLRPDGYVAWAGDGEDGLDEAIGRLMRAEGGRTEGGQAEDRPLEGRRGNARL
jgi:oxygenase/bifunctional oxygenase/reductase